MVCERMKRTILGEMLLGVAIATSSLTFGGNLDYGIPNGTNTHLEVKEREGFAIGYDRALKQPRWVAYRLTGEMLKKDSMAIVRTNDFRADEEFGRDSAMLDDYRGSGYDRGHICPARDMAYSKKAMHESFLLSNTSPQAPGFNRGIWKEMEAWVRDVAAKEGSIYILCGPVFGNPTEKTIGDSRIPVPIGFWKVVFDETPPIKAIGFYFENRAMPDRFLCIRQCAVKEVEEKTGLLLFGLLPQVIRRNLKEHFDYSEWGMPIEFGR